MSVTSSGVIHTRSLILHYDASDLVRIEWECFGNQGMQRHQFCQFFEQPRSFGRVAISRQTGAIVGHALYSQCRTHVQIEAVAVAKQVRRRGVGRKLIESIQGDRVLRRNDVFRACVTERNIGAQLFFQKCGWMCVEIDRDSYAHGDGYIFTWDREAEAC